MLKRMKWINSFLLLFALFSFLSTMAYADNSIGWEINEEGVLTITGEGVIPPSYHPWENDYTLMDKVTSIIISEGINTIGKSAFGSNFFTRVNTVHFPTTLEKIAASNFTWLNNLKRVDLPEGLIEIGDNCFTNCSNLSSVRLPSSLTSIGMRCFNGSGIVSITIPASVTYIGQGAFSQSKALQSIKVEENNPNYIDRNGVLYSKSNSIILCCYPAGKPEITFTVPSDVSAIGESAFSGNKSLETVNISSNVISMGTDSFFSCSALKRVDIPESINVIPSGAFCNCKLLTTVSIPESVTSIRSRAFYGCTSLNSIEIPDSVKYIGNSPNFSSSSPVVFPVETTIICTKGSVADDYARAYGNHVIYTDGTEYVPPTISWNISEDGTLTISGEGILSSNYRPWENDYTLSDKVISIVFDEGITAISDGAFNNFFRRAKTIQFPSTLREIGRDNFRLLSINKVLFPEGLTKIGDLCFTNCRNLTTLSLPSSLTTIGTDCFSDTGIGSISIPASVTYIGQGAFSRCVSLKNIYVDEDNENYQSRDGILFSNLNNENTLLCFPSGRFETEFTIPSDVTAISSYAFSGNKTLETIWFHNGVTHIDRSCFSSCAALKTINLPSGISTIFSDTFYNCKQLETVNIPNSVTVIQSTAFSGCVSLATIKIPDSVQYIGNSPNFSSSNPTVFPTETVIICNKGSAADSYAEEFRNRVVHIEDYEKNALPQGLNTIETEAFLNSAFDTVFISNDVKFIGDNAFSKDTIIICKAGSFADTWATQNGYIVIYDESIV